MTHESLRELGIGPRFSLGAVLEALQVSRGRPIVVKPAEWLEGTGATGLWIPFEDVDEILHLPTSSLLYRTQIILHELGHMILRHDEVFEAKTALLEPFLGQLTERATAHALARTTHRNDYEIAAEKLADEMFALIRGASSEPAYFEEILG